ncbi:MAG: hypothetical protein MK142_07945, partial [Pseudomonadales bacterium]|nr:hypothetical protein [Pseudomonadales bacterium]
DMLGVLSMPASNGEEFFAFEQAAQALGREFADRVVEAKVLQAHVDTSARRIAGKEARERFREAGETQRIDNMGPRPASVRLAGGRILRLKTPYYRPNRKGLVGRPRTKRGPDGTGCYPVLERLGIRGGVTPLTRSKICRQIVQCGSYAEALEQLHSEGLELDATTLVRVAVATGSAALERRNAQVVKALEAPLPERSLVEGKRVRVSVDGGRSRTRNTHSERRKKKNGRRAFEVPWREPRLITIDVLTDEGKLDPNTPPIYEADLGNADQVFDLLAGLLRLIGAHKASELVFVSDGADWIWDRVEQLVERGGLDPERVRKVLDFYHASEHVSDALKACKNLSDKERKAKHKALCQSLLELDGVEQVVQDLSLLARGRRGKRINREISYLRKHANHMQYAAWKAANIPIGSGVVESAIRRVVNLRFKAASTFWREDHLAALLYLRCALKAGRWDALLIAHLRGEHWLTPPDAQSNPLESEAA